MNVINFFKTLSIICKETKTCYHCSCEPICKDAFSNITDDEIDEGIKCVEARISDSKNCDTDENTMSAKDWLKCVRKVCTSYNEKPCDGCPWEKIICYYPLGLMPYEMIFKIIEAIKTKEKTK